MSWVGDLLTYSWGRTTATVCDYVASLCAIAWAAQVICVPPALDNSFVYLIEKECCTHKYVLISVKLHVMTNMHFHKLNCESQHIARASWVQWATRTSLFCLILFYVYVVCQRLIGVHINMLKYTVYKNVFIHKQ